MADNVWRYLINLGATEQEIADKIATCQRLDSYVGHGWCLEPKDFINKVFSDLGGLIVYAVYTFRGED